MKIISLIILYTLIYSSISQDDPGQSQQVKVVPGYPSSGAPRVFAGWLHTKNDNFPMHYILVQGKDGKKNSLPLTVWFNGGPGCTSKIGFLQQIGPYILPQGSLNITTLIENKYSWHTISNLLFIDTPIGTGYNQPPNNSYLYNDHNTVQDNLNALLYFFNQKFPSYYTKKVYFTGTGYAGKYIPDLVLRVSAINDLSEKKIFLTGIMIGNGVMDLSDDSLEKSQVQYIFSKNIIDPTLDPYWTNSCQSDPTSAGCAFFFNRYDNLLNLTNLQNIYSNCLKQQPTISLQSKRNINIQYQNLFKKCQYYSGINLYFSKNSHIFNVTNKSQFLSCNQTIYTNYQKTQAGSMYQYGHIINVLPNINIYLYNGDWDDTVPFTNTLYNLDRLAMVQNSTMTPLFDIKKQQHVGFSRTFVQGSRKLIFWMIKGAGLKATINKGQTVLQLLKNMLGN